MKTTLLLTLFFLHIVETKAQVGTLDPSFGTNGHVILGVTFKATAFQPDGKLVGIRTVNEKFVINRYDINGNPDATFGNNGMVITDVGARTDLPPITVQAWGGGASDVAINNDGRIVVIGTSLKQYSAAGVPVPERTLVFYNSDGSPDITR